MFPLRSVLLVMFASIILSKFCTKFLKSGKKSKAEKIVYKIFYEIIRSNLGKLKVKKPFYLLFLALINLRPLVELREVRRGRKRKVLVPFPVRKKRRIMLALRFLLRDVDKRFLAKSVAEKIIIAAQGRGEAVQRLAESQKAVESGRPFLHYRWI
jgi:ribosomal protein S7